VQTENVAVMPLFDPPARHWYSADMHHHADQAEAVTPPADLARSQLAAGLDLLFVSDHDSTANHGPLQAIADRRGIAFIPGIELSASWGHFNAYPLLPGQKLNIDTGTASIDDIIREGRRQGAAVVQVNHPFIPYGYFTSVSTGVAPGGFNPTFDLIEINAEEPADDAKVRSADDLVSLYFSSVGRNSNLLLNVPPTRDGLLHGTDVSRLTGMRAALSRMFQHDLAAKRHVTWQRTGARAATATVDLGHPVSVGIADLREDIEHGQLVARYVVEGHADGEWQPLSRGTTIGHRKLDRFEAATVGRVRLTIEDAVDTPRPVRLRLYEA